MFKAYFKIVLLVVALSLPVLSQTRQRPTEKLFVKLAVPSFSEIEEREVPLTLNSGIGGGGGCGSSHGSCSGSYFYSIIVEKLERGFAVIRLTVEFENDDGTKGEMRRRLAVRVDEVVTISLKNGIKVTAYFENAKAIIEKEKL